MMTQQSDLVFCHSGHEYPERPYSFIWKGQRLQIDRVNARWRTPQGKRYLVSTTDNLVFELEYFEYSDVWQIQPAG